MNHNLYYFLKYIRNTIIVFLIFAQYANAQSPLSNFTSNKQAGCSPLTVSFQDLSTGSPTSWLWDFGNGLTSTVQNPSIFYSNPGLYTVKLTATNANGSNILTRTNYINVYESPTINFIANNTTGCISQKIQFSDLSTAGSGNTNVSWLWDFNNGTSSNIKNPLVSFTAAGNYSVFLKVTNDKGCEKTLSKPNFITITPSIIVDFDNSPPNVCKPPAQINFTNKTTGPGTLTYLWNFGDGNTSTEITPSHIYSKAGTFSISLVVKNLTGCADSLIKVDKITIGGITTSFTSPDEVCVNSSIEFKNTSSPSPVSNLWLFGDGTSSSEKSPIKTYTTAGVYDVFLINTYAHCTDIFTKKIIVNDRVKPDFTSPDTVKCEPTLNVNFQNLSFGAVSWQWDFGDSTSSTLQNPSHLYKNYGFYDVKLIVKNAAGCVDSIIKKSFIKIKRAQISIFSLPYEGCVPFSIVPNPTINTVDKVTSYLWDFGDGNTSTAPNPLYTYFKLGAYDVKLKITTSTGCKDSIVINEAVRIGTKPKADFSASPIPVCAFKPITFTNLSTTSDKWIWHFGGSDYSFAKNPIYSYKTLEPDTITLIAINFGCRDTIQKVNYVSVLPPIAKFKVTPNCNNRFEFSFSDDSKGALTWLWDFGDGKTSTSQNPVHLFSAYTSYTVTLTVTNGSCSHSTSMSVQPIKELPTFIASELTGCKNFSTEFSAQNLNFSNIASYLWDFGDSGNKNTKSITTNYTYVNSGNFDVKLLTTDLNGCTDMYERKNYIRVNGPIAKYSATNISGCYGFTTTFNDQSTSDGINKIKLWNWNFGDGTIKSFTNSPFQHTYNLPGTFAVKLTITDEFGCIDSIQIKDLINASNPKASFSSVDTLSCPGATVKFSNNTAAQNYSSIWDFGDLGSSTQSSASYSYSTAKNYSVKLSITDQYGCKDSITKTDYIKINLPKADFLMSDSISACIPLQINYTNNSFYSSKQKWDFGIGESSLQNPSFLYTDPGNYQTKLVITSPGGCQDSITKNVIIYDITDSKLDFQILSGCKPLAVDFQTTSTTNIKQYIWNFGDGNSITTTTSSVKHIYKQLGNYTPEVLLIEASGCTNLIKSSNTISVLGSNPNFSVDKILLCDSGFINFKDSSFFNNPITNYSWNFGDGQTSILKNPSHNYLNPGNYNVSLKIQTQLGCIDSIQKTNIIKAVQSPLIKITGDSIACIFNSMLHKGTFLRTDTSAVIWNWTFPNNNTSNLKDPLSQTYLTVGSQLLNVIVTNSSGCTDKDTKQILINPLPESSVQDTLIILAGNPAKIPITYSTNVANYLWTPAEGLDCPTCPQPFAVPKFTTTYHVIYTDSNGCKNSDAIKIIVHCNNTNIFIPNTFSPNGDGRNDVFYPRGTGINRVKVLRIFNRLGEVVFENRNFNINDPLAGWDGTYKGNKAQSDVYVYQAELFCDNGQLIVKDGNIALIY